VVGAYLHGSLATWSYVAGRSDVDVLLITRDALGNAAAERVLGTLHAIAPDAPCRFDLEIVTAEVAGNPNRRPRVECLRIPRANPGDCHPRSSARPRRRVLGDPPGGRRPDRSIVRRAHRRTASRVDRRPWPRPARPMVGSHGRHRTRRADGPDRLPHLALGSRATACLEGGCRQVGAGPRSDVERGSRSPRAAKGTVEPDDHGDCHRRCACRGACGYSAVRPGSYLADRRQLKQVALVLVRVIGRFRDQLPRRRHRGQ